VSRWCIGNVEAYYISHERIYSKNLDSFLKQILLIHDCLVV